MSRASLLGIFGFGVVLFALSWLAAVQVRNQREELMQRFVQERFDRVQEAARRISESFDDVGDDLRLGGELASQPQADAQHERELRAFLEAVRGYKALALARAGSPAPHVLKDRRADARVRSGAFDDRLGKFAIEVLGKDVGKVLASPTLDDASGDRIFALRSSEDTALAVLVDTNPIFTPLRVAAAEKEAQVLVIGPHGRAAPSSDPELARAFAHPSAKAAHSWWTALEKMRRNESGYLVISSADARSVGLTGEAMLVFLPVPVTDGAPWMVAALFPTEPIRTQERNYLVRSVAAGSAFAVFVFVFAAFVVVASRRAVALRESRRNAEKLAHLHEKAQKIFDSIPTGVLVLSADGRVTSVNRALRTDGHSPRSLHECFPLAPADSLEPLSTLVEGAKSAKLPRTLRAAPLMLYGTPGLFTLHAVPLEKPDADASMLLVIEDLSAVQALESQLVRAEKLATVGALAAGIAHEVGTPLGVVRARAEYLVSKLGKDHPQAESARVVISEIDRITRTIRQLLDFSRLQQPALEPVSPAALCRDVAELLELEAERRQVQLVVNVTEPLPQVSADPDQLRQVLVNLLMNALHASKKDGKVELRCEAREPGTLSFVVEDDGSGIAPENLNQVFDPFFTTRKRGQGTGLGLAIVSQIARNHGATVELESEPGKGTVAKLRWPLAPASMEAVHG